MVFPFVLLKIKRAIKTSSPEKEHLKELLQPPEYSQKQSLRQGVSAALYLQVQPQDSESEAKGCELREDVKKWQSDAAALLTTSQ